MRSWASAGDFILEAFGVQPFASSKPDGDITEPVDYVDPMDGANMTGHLALPADSWQKPSPAVVIFPDWDGVNEYERERATILAEMGYVAFAADIYGSDLQFVEDFGERAELVGTYFGNPELFMSRMQTAIDQVKARDDVDSDEIAIIGYCFGGKFNRSTGITIVSPFIILSFCH